MTQEDNHVTRITPDDESVEYEMNSELGRQEQREINRRVQWAREQRAKEAGHGEPPGAVAPVAP